MNTDINYLVLLGATSDTTNISFSGTGVIIVKENRVFICTCRHVIWLLSKHRMKFAVFNPKKTTNINVELIESPKFYNNEEPYIDLCLCEIKNANKDILRQKGIGFLDFKDLSHQNFAKAHDEIIFYGYPSILNKQYLMENNESESLPIYKIIGHSIDAKSDHSALVDEESGLELKFDSLKAALAYCPKFHIGGMSGGAVVCSATKELRGIFTASTKHTPINGYDFVMFYTDVRYLIEMLEKY